jgi:hypothetical protein
MLAIFEHFHANFEMWGSSDREWVGQKQLSGLDSQVCKYLQYSDISVYAFLLFKSLLHWQ